MDTNLIGKFLFLSVINYKEQTRFDDLCFDDVLDILIKKAELDTLIGGRFYYGYLSIRKSLKDDVSQMIKVEKNGNPRLMIKELSIKHGLKNVGFIQKIVNMTFKYMICYKELYFPSDNELDFLVEDCCDCPLDSNILNKINCSSVRWTKIQTFDEYVEYQNAIDRLCKEKGYSNKMEFDFREWK